MDHSYLLNKIVEITLDRPVHEQWRIDKKAILHPLSLGFYPSIGDWYGQIADQRVALTDGRGIHCREYKFTYGFHWDHRDPSIDPIGHMIEDAPHWLVIIGAGTAIGLLCWAAYRSQRN